MSNEHGSKWIRPAKRQAIYNRDGRRCVYCRGRAGESIDPCSRSGARYLTLDHLRPRALGGSHSATNLVTSCLTCNSIRAAGSLRTWFVTLRSWGVDTDKLQRRIRRLVRKPLEVK